MINLNIEYLNEIKTILLQHVPNEEILAFGSRVNGNPTPYSDLDLVIKAKKPLTLQQLSTLKDAFSASNLPIMVDVLDWHALSPSFQKKIEEAHETIQSGK